MSHTAEAILSRNDKPITSETLMTLLRYPDFISKDLFPASLVTSKDQLKMTALHLALVHHTPNLLQLLIKRGVDVTLRIPAEHGDLSPLLYAILNCASDIKDRPWPGCCESGYGVGISGIKNVKILLKAGLKINEKHHDGMTPLFQAVLLDKTQIVRLLLSYGGDANTNLANGLSLDDACQSHQMRNILDSTLLSMK
ncbi:ankyrin repeat domain-containing protein [Maridesulfovibrio hydrothermalis]|nr:ankyrin repeat domain-containing protein [Maridesulfovibrio hydrothermalis]